MRTPVASLDWRGAAVFVAAVGSSVAAVLSAWTVWERQHSKKKDEEERR